MRGFIYRLDEGALISVFNPDTDQFEDVDPVDFMEERAAAAGLTHVRINRSITVCVYDAADLLTWKLIEPVTPFMEYLGYP